MYSTDSGRRRSPVTEFRHRCPNTDSHLVVVAPSCAKSFVTPPETDAKRWNHSCMAYYSGVESKAAREVIHLGGGRLTIRAFRQIYWQLRESVSGIRNRKGGTHVDR